jgi:hypothetical protein
MLKEIKYRFQCNFINALIKVVEKRTVTVRAKEV